MFIATNVYGWTQIARREGRDYDRARAMADARAAGLWAPCSMTGPRRVLIIGAGAIAHHHAAAARHLPDTRLLAADPAPEAEDMVPAYLFPASSGARYVTAKAFAVDGGLLS
ncbi:hypothetical protein [Histidinibacterium lentulum]|uniref:Uncharacterized protein n=1 Tax=Histidinibacterium lentulum TaxID=2480588 RepID=A0A3N2QY75_9RHOB|nr:hypothetical protein [Histidinibacterium lentulum]ROU00162.1 hypothetical protein EAT49_12705 [Histidinibacterium lentulum]